MSFGWYSRSYMYHSSPTDIASQTWCVVPLYNESGVVVDVINELRETFPNVVCVDDGSSDNSAELVRSFGVTVIQHAINLGQGAALQTGFDYVRSIPDAKYVVTFDADGQHDPKDALAMVNLLIREDLDIVFATRFGGLDSHGMSSMKKVVLRSIVRLQQLFTRTTMTDTHNGLRVFSRSVLDRVSITQNGMAHASELEGLTRKKRLRFAELPVTIRYTTYSKSKGQSLLNGVNIIFDLVWR